MSHKLLKPGELQLAREDTEYTIMVRLKRLLFRLDAQMCHKQHGFPRLNGPSEMLSYADAMCKAIEMYEKVVRPGGKAPRIRKSTETGDQSGKSGSTQKMRKSFEPGSTAAPPPEL